MGKYDELLSGAIDLHVHAYPDVSLEHPQRKSNREVIDECRAAGMAGIVLKTHGWPEPGLARELDQAYDDFTVFPSATLNLCAGGCKPWVAEMAVKMGARMVWFPTWTSRNEWEQGGFRHLMANYVPRTTGIAGDEFISLVGEDGRATDDVRQVVEICRDADVALGTGHVSAEESRAVALAARDLGLKRLVLTHPDSSVAKNTVDQIIEFAQMGFYAEFCALNTQPALFSLRLEDARRIIEEAGPEHCFVSTDHFFDWTPSIPAQIYELMGQLELVGVPYEDLYVMSRTPRRIMGLED